MTPSINRYSSSFRDTSGFLFFDNGKLFRSINRLYQQNYDHLIQSGLYSKLVAGDLLIPHREVYHITENRGNTYKVIQPEIVPFISYPYEWCFSQLRDAALTTIKIQKQALDCNMIMKDASAYNIQFYKGKPILIDTLSFEIYKKDQPWIAYRQFCQHFLAPLSLMALRDIRLGQLIRIYIDGLPLDLVSGLLPISTWVKPGGRLYLSVPIGRQTIEFNAHRIFAPSTISVFMTQLCFEMLEFSYLDDDGNFHEAVQIPERCDCAYGCGCFIFRRLL